MPVCQDEGIFAKYGPDEQKARFNQIFTGHPSIYRVCQCLPLLLLKLLSTRSRLPLLKLCLSYLPPRIGPFIVSFVVVNDTADSWIFHPYRGENSDGSSP